MHGCSPDAAILVDHARGRFVEGLSFGSWSSCRPTKGHGSGHSRAIRGLRSLSDLVCKRCCVGLVEGPTRQSKIWCLVACWGRSNVQVRLSARNQEIRLFVPIRNCTAIYQGSCPTRCEEFVLDWDLSLVVLHRFIAKVWDFSCRWESFCRFALTQFLDSTVLWLILYFLDSLEQGLTLG